MSHQASYQSPKLRCCKNQRGSYCNSSLEPTQEGQYLVRDVEHRHMPSTRGNAHDSMPQRDLIFYIILNTDLLIGSAGILEFRALPSSVFHCIYSSISIKTTVRDSDWDSALHKALSFSHRQKRCRYPRHQLPCSEWCQIPHIYKGFLRGTSSLYPRKTAIPLLLLLLLCALHTIWKDIPHFSIAYRHRSY